MLSVEKINKLEQENAELKADLKSQQMTNLKQQEIALDYWNALQEIKEIAEENKDTAQYGGICKSILDLITKVEKE